MAINFRNTWTGLGRLADDPKVFGNTDGSRKVKFTVMCEDNYRTKDGKRTAQAVRLEAFVTAEKAANKTVYDLIHKGDLVGITATIRNNVWTDKETGKPHYENVILVQSVDILESKRITDARQAKYAAEAAQTAQEQPTQAPTQAQVQTQAPAPVQEEVYYPEDNDNDYMPFYGA